MFKTIPLSLPATALGAMLATAPAPAAEDVTLGAGKRGGAHYAFGRAICRLLDRSVDGLACSLLPTPGGDAPDSFTNLVNLRNGTIEIGIARSDWQHYAVKRTGPVKHMFGNFDSIRSLFSIHSQPFTLLARGDSGIKALGDLPGKRINLGKPYSDDRATMELVMQAKGWRKKDFVLVEEVPVDQQSLVFCYDRVQAIYYVVTHPDDAVQRLAKFCNARLVPVAGPQIEQLVASHPYLTAVEIPGGLYANAPKPVKTFGATLTVVSSSDVPEETVYRLVKGIFDNLKGLKTMHPALRDLAPERMSKDGLTAPLHPGAERFFQEQGHL